MNMKKYIALVLGIMMIATALCGCGSDEKTKTDEKSEAGTTQVTETKKADDKEAAKEEDKKEDVTANEKVAETSPEKEEKKDLGATNKESSSSDAPLAMPAGAAGVEGQENTKYGEDDVYTNASGVPAAKTESGTEVELTGETLQELMDEYGKVTGTGTPEEKELLEKIQVLLETMPYAQSAN